MKKQNFEPDSLIEVIEGISINYRAHFLSDAGPTLVFVHGFAANLRTWDDISPFFYEKYSVICIDLKGFGFSSKPRDGKYSLYDQARILTSLLKKLKQNKVILLGHSLGGAISLLSYFESLLSPCGITVKGIVLIDSAGYLQNFPFFISIIRNPITRFLFYLIKNADFKVRFVLRKVFKVKEQITLERIRRYSYFLNKKESNYVLYQTTKQMIPEQANDLILKFSTIDVPVLVLWGGSDPVISVENAHRFHRDIPNSRLIVLKDTGHIPHEERPYETFLAVNSFLQSII